MKASAVDRALSLAALERHLGPYAPAAPEVLARAAATPFRIAPDGGAGRREGVAPRPRGFAANEAALYRRHRAEEARNAERRRRSVAEVRAEHGEHRRALAAWHAERIGARGISPAERARRRARRAEDLAEARGREAEAVALAAGAHPALTWRGFLEREAGRGEPSALEALRRRGWVPCVGPPPEDPDAAPAPHHLRPQARADGGRAYPLRDGGRVVDAGSCLRLERVTEGAIRFALDMAAERWAGAPLRLEGSDDFRRRTAAMAGERRVAVVFGDAGLEALRRAAGGLAPAEQARAREKRTAAAAAKAAEAHRPARGTPRLAWTPSRRDKTGGPPERDPGRGRGGLSR